MNEFNYLKYNELEILKNKYFIPNNIKKDMLGYCISIRDKPLIEYLKDENMEDELDNIFKLIYQKEITLENILNLQKIVIPKNTTKLGFRDSRIFIKTNKKIKSIIEKVDFEKELNTLLQLYYTSKLNIFNKLALFHLLFEKIHPFRDGNGRVGRILINIELLKNGYPIFQKDDGYYEGINEYRNNKNIMYMSEYILNESYENFKDLKNINMLVERK